MSWEHMLRRMLNDPRVIQKMSDHHLMRSAARNSISLFYRAFEVLERFGKAGPFRIGNRRIDKFNSLFQEEYKKAIEKKS